MSGIGLHTMEKVRRLGRRAEPRREWERQRGTYLNMRLQFWLVLPGLNSVRPSSSSRRAVLAEMAGAPSDTHLARKEGQEA